MQPRYLELLDLLRHEYEYLRDGTSGKSPTLKDASLPPISSSRHICAPIHRFRSTGDMQQGEENNIDIGFGAPPVPLVSEASRETTTYSSNEYPTSDPLETALEVPQPGEKKARSKKQHSLTCRSGTEMLDHDPDVDVQYEMMLSKIRVNSTKPVTLACCGIGPEDAEEVREWIAKRRFPCPRLERFIKGRCFHTLICTLILANVGVIIAQSDNALKVAFGKNQDGAQDKFFFTVDIAFTSMFLVELILRMIVEELGFLFGENWRWNYFDSCLVATSVAESLLDGMGIDATVARVLRVLRMSRALKIIRMFKVFRELRVLLDSIFHIMLPLAWSVLTLSLVIVMFSLIFINGVTGIDMTTLSEVSKRNLEEYYRDAPTVFLSLFMCLTNGQSWLYVMAPLQVISDWYVAIFIIFVVFIQLGVLNIITSVFVGNAALFAQMDLEMIELAEADQHRYTMNQLTDVFDILDRDGSGGISLDEFEEWTRIEKVRAFFERVLGLEAWKVGRFFRLLDVNGDQKIDREEFVVGCMRLKGGAKNMDQEVLTHLAKMIKSDMKAVKAYLKNIERRFCDADADINTVFEHGKEVVGY